jgi:hypothetical protein
MLDNRCSVTHKEQNVSFAEEDASVPLLIVERPWVERLEDQRRRRDELPMLKVSMTAMVTR